MGALRNIEKKQQRIHKERSQISGRRHLGPLEKKKDYKIRATVQANHKKTILALKKRALERNPDEFYYHMLNSNVKNGIHYEKEEEEEEEEFTDAQIKLMQTQDIKYIRFKQTADYKKIEKLKANHHLIDIVNRPKNKHTFFVESKKEAKKFDVAERLNTHASLIDRPSNRPTLDSLKANVVLKTPTDEKILKASILESSREYKSLRSRIVRERRLLVLTQKMEMKRHLANKKAPPSQRIKPGTKDSAPIYKWKTERQK